MTASYSKISSVIQNQLPSWVWPVAVILGVFLAVSSLSYAPLGRINILWIWLIWAGLPCLGSFVALGFLSFGRAQPWLFRWREHRLEWYPSTRERLYMLLRMQQLWLVLGLGLLLGYFALLAFTDLAFGWSSTLVDDAHSVAIISRALAAPWAWCWPGAVPSFELVEVTRYARIQPQATQAYMAGGWWQFLLASLLFYNLLPRLFLAVIIGLLLHRMADQKLTVRAPLATTTVVNAPTLQVDSVAHWQSAVNLTWELPSAELRSSSSSSQSQSQLRLGLADWQADEQALQNLLVHRPQQLCWQVNASRSPVAELADLIALARAAGVGQQAVQLVLNTATDPQRHIASWRTFASQQRLVWLEEMQ